MSASVGRRIHSVGLQGNIASKYNTKYICILGADARPFQLDSIGSRSCTGTRGGSWEDQQRRDALRRPYFSQRYTVRRKGMISLWRTGTIARSADVINSEARILFTRVKIKHLSSVWQIQRSHGVMYIPFDGKEIPCRDYEVLVQCWILFTIAFTNTLRRGTFT